MTSIDDLFKKPNLPIGSGKRKFEEPDAQQAYKSTKVSDSSSPHTNGKASVEDAPDDDEDMDQLLQEAANAGSAAAEIDTVGFEEFNMQEPTSSAKLHPSASSRTSL